MPNTTRGVLRDANLEKLVQRELSVILSCAEDERVASLLVTHVESQRRAKQFLVLFGPPPPDPADESPLDIAEAQRVLERAYRWIRSELATGLELKRVPELVFVPDPVAWAALTVPPLDDAACDGDDRRDEEAALA